MPVRLDLVRQGGRIYCFCWEGMILAVVGSLICRKCEWIVVYGLDKHKAVEG